LFACLYLYKNFLVVVNYAGYELPFRHAFTISHGTKTHQPTLIVQLQLGPYVGYGEAAAIKYYNVSVNDMINDLEKKKTFVEKFALTDPERYWHYLYHLFPNNPFLVCALDMAGWDLWGKMKKVPVYELMGTRMENTPLTDYTIGIDSIDKMVEKIKEKPWPIYKIKLGTETDIEIVEALRKHTDAVFRVDANSGWTTEEAMKKIPLLKELGVELIEQPLHKENWDGMKQLFAHSPLPLIADESCVSEKDVQKCHNHFHGINIKLTKCSGITPARRMIKKARELDMKVMMGCMNESSVGSAAIVQFLPQLDYVDVDGPLLLAQDIAAGLHYDYGKVTISNKAGLGIDLIQL
jgi:L-alanine-DL-glutamate epimerase-like enolase superfamily enzyme